MKSSRTIISYILFVGAAIVIFSLWVSVFNAWFGFFGVILAFIIYYPIFIKFPMILVISPIIFWLIEGNFPTFYFIIGVVGIVAATIEEMSEKDN